MLPSDKRSRESHLVYCVHHLVQHTALTLGLASGLVQQRIRCKFSPRHCAMVCLTQQFSGCSAVSMKRDLTAICSIGHGIHLYSLPSFSHIQTIHHPYFREGVSVKVVFAQSDSLLIVGSDHGRVCIYDVCTGAFVTGLPHASPSKCIFSHLLLFLT
jgi:hypothetical protein